jgi:hypothetical protein
MTKLDNYPPGFWEAEREHSRKMINSPDLIWSLLKYWRNPPGQWSNSLSEHFEARILNAVRSGDADFIQALLTAIKCESGPPTAELSAISAAIWAFNELFSSEVCGMTRAEWPTKSAVRQLAEEVLRKEGHKPRSKRQWSRILADLGLSCLPETRGRPKSI